MHMFTERTQVLLSKQQVGRLKRLAVRERRSVGAVIRDAIDAYAGPTESDRREAAERLVSMNLPVADWETMKAEIIRGRYGDDDPADPFPQG